MASKPSTPGKAAAATPAGPDLARVREQIDGIDREIQSNGHVDESPLCDVLAELGESAGDVRVLGSYPVAVP